MEWKWVSLNSAKGFQAQQLEWVGGGRGLRDECMLESVIMRSQNLAAYGKPTVFELAASYAFGLAKNHPFVDGSKRTDFGVSLVFLLKNGQALNASEVEATLMFMRLAAGEVEEESLAAWFVENCEPSTELVPS